MSRSVSSAALCLSLFISGCATMVHGSDQAIPIISDPPGARVAIDSNPVGVTPLVARVSRRQNHVVSVTHDSFPPIHIALEHNLSAWVLGNLALYYLPAIADFGTGAAYEFAKDTLRANFTTLTTGADSSIRGYPTPRTRFTPEARATAATYSAVIGFGVGHAMMGAGAAGRPFRYAQIGSLLTATAALGGIGAGEGGGATIFYGSAVVFVGSRVWEVIDVLTRPEETRLQVMPLVDRHRVGAGLRIAF